MEPELPKKTLNANDFRLAKSASAFEEQCLKPIEDIVTGVRPEFTFNKIAAEKLVKMWRDLSVEIFEQNLINGSFVISIKAMAELVEENALDDITAELYPEQLDAIKKIFKYVSILNNFKKK